MTNKERVRAALAGESVERAPVTAIYNFLYKQDHFVELTGQPFWRARTWRTGSPEEYLETFAQMQQQAPFELLQPDAAPSRPWRQRQRIVEEDGRVFRHDPATGEKEALDWDAVSGHACDYHANETRHLRSVDEVDEQITFATAEAEIADGRNDYLDAVIARYGADEYILSGGVIGTLYSCHHQVGLTNLYALLVEEPELIEALSERLLARNLEIIRRLAAAGGDGIYIDDATATSDMISPAMYDRFCFPYVKAMVDEIHRLGHHAILIYFGGVADRLERLADTGADGLVYEASMKGFVNDTADFARRVGERLTLFSNIDPVGVLQNGSAAELEAEIRRQLEAAGPARGFILSPASPITPQTPLARVQEFLELGRRLGRRG